LKYKHKRVEKNKINREEEKTDYKDENRGRNKRDD
jgi:hypothetical protein